MKLSLGAVMVLTALLAACEPIEPVSSLPPPSGSMDYPYCGTQGDEIMLLFDTSARMNLGSGYYQGSTQLTRQQLVVDALKRTIPQLKRKADFGLLTFPFGDRRDRDGNLVASAPDSCNVGDIQVAPGDPYGWIVSQVEAIQVGGKASVAGALDRARQWFDGHPAAGRARAVVLFTAGGDECGGEMVAAVTALMAQGIPTWVLSFANSADAALLNLAAEKGGRAMKGNPQFRYYAIGADSTLKALQDAVEEAYVEVCDGLDNDCDGLTDEEFDLDGDGWATCYGDCDDLAASRYPGAVEGGRDAPYAAGRISGWYQGKTRDGLSVPAAVSGVGAALAVDGQAFSLGFDGFVEVEFDCPVKNGPGADVAVWELTPAEASDTESAAVYAWDAAAKAWVLLGVASSVGDRSGASVKTVFDLGPLAQAARIRVVNATAVAAAPAGADGFDVDGVYALQNCGDCDGEDNDCDGTVDEGYGAGGTCVVGEGGCRAFGQMECSSDGMKAVCAAHALAPDVETCNGVDDDCDGQVDEATSLACTTACGKGHKVCAAGTLTTCVIEVPNLEMCNGVDDDCDGLVDEGFKVGFACVVGTSQCAAFGVTACSEDGLETVCVVDSPEGKAETCNGKDDDCDGVIDNGKGLCPDGQVCYKGQCVYD